MRFFFVLAMGRSGTQFLASLLQEAPGARVEHEPDRFDSKLLGLRWAGRFDVATDGFLEERFARVLAGADGYAVYGEVNSYLRYEPAWLRRHFDAVLLHLVRDGRAFLVSAYNRLVYTPGEAQLPIVPPDGDPYATAWAGMSRFERLCWLWAHTNAFLLEHVPHRVRFEAILTDYDRFAADVLRPLDLAIPRAVWERHVARPANTSAANVRRRVAKRLLGLDRDPLEELPPWPEWDAERRDAFWRICGPVMERCGYAA